MTQPFTPADSADLPIGTADSVLDRANARGTKTPLFHANSAARYQRQSIIREIQENSGSLLVCYVSGDKCVIDHNDTMPFVDLLHKIPSGRDVDLLLHTAGGSIDAAEKLIRMIRPKIEGAKFRIIVPDFAKSAGTVMVLGADSVVMSDMSELGPIDPQVLLVDRWHSGQNYIDAYATHAVTLKKEPENIAARIMLGKLDPTILKQCETAKNRARQSAESLLKHGMFREGGNWSQAVSELLDTTRWLSHSQMISWEDARDLELVVEYLDYQSEQWQRYWALYCLQRLAIQDRQKCFESESASLIIGPAG